MVTDHHVAYPHANGRPANALKLWSVATGRVVGQIECGAETPIRLGFSPDGSRVTAVCGRRNRPPQCRAKRTRFQLTEQRVRRMADSNGTGF